MKRTMILFGAIFALVASSITAQQGLTTVAVVRIEQVYTSFFSASQGVRFLEEEQQNAEDEIEAQQNELRALVESFQAAQSQNRFDDALEIQEEISAKRQFILEYKAVLEQRLRDDYARLAQSDDFVQALAQAIRAVAESGGFSVVLRSSDQQILYYSPAVDITDQVVRRLQSIL